MNYQDLAANYAQMSDDELLDLGEDYASLTPEAQDALRNEFHNRKLDPPEIAEATPQTAPTAQTPDFTGSDLVEPEAVRQFHEPREVAAAMALLHQAGIAAHLQPYQVSGASAYDGMRTLFRLWVSAADFEHANALLSQMENAAMPLPEETDYEGPQCPRCHSTDVALEAEAMEEDDPLAGENGDALTRLEFHPVADETAVPAADFAAKWKCMACGNTWQEQDADPAED